MTGFDWRNPDYPSIIGERAARLSWMRQNPSELPALRRYYAVHPWQFISDWGMTFDPRNVERGLPSVIPFVLFPKQVEWCEWFVDHWQRQRHGLTEKSRDQGMSWLTVALAISIGLFRPGVVAGFGSRKEEYVDKIGSPKSLFWKGRFFLENLPREFTGGYDSKKHAPHMRIILPTTGSYLTGESGDGIGRGDRTSFYFVDEAAFLERPKLVDASLSQTTNCRHDISSANGLGNPFAQKRHSGKIDVFTFHWRDDPRKDQAWYDKQVEDLDPVVVAQEIDINYSASVEGVLIPSAWAMAALDAHRKLGIDPSGDRLLSLDVADEGADMNAAAGRYGFLIEHLEAWSGAGSDIFGTVERAFALADRLGYRTVRYDSDGLGAGVRGDARVINDQRRMAGDAELDFDPFRGSGAVVEPEEEMVPGRLNKDFFANAKAQAWWALRMRFQHTYRAVVEGKAYDPEQIVSISTAIPGHLALIAELSQPTYTLSTLGKVLVNKAPAGTKSPNLADAVMMSLAPVEQRGGFFAR